MARSQKNTIKNTAPLPISESHNESALLRIACKRKLANFALDINLDITLSGVIAIIGASGAGKTSFLRCLAGLDKMEGYCYVGSQIWQQQNIVCAPNNRSIGFVFQHSALFTFMSVEKNIMYGFTRSTNKKNTQLIEKTVALFKLKPLLNQHPSALSGGERQRVALARAILFQPKILILDEPLASIDSEHKKEILTYIKRIYPELGIPIVYVSHQVEEIVTLADYIVMLDAGKVIDQGSTDVMSSRLLANHFKEDKTQLFSLFHGHAKLEPQLVVVKIGSDVLKIPYAPSITEGEARVRVYADNVSISKIEPSQTSILNNLPCTIVAIHNNQQTGGAYVHLDWQGRVLYSHISAYSCEHLNLVVGEKVYAQVKAVSLQC